MIQEGTLVEVPFKTAGEEAHAVLVQFRLIPFTDKPVLLVQDAVVGQHLDSLSLETMQPFSTASRGSLFSTVVAFRIFLIHSLV